MFERLTASAVRRAAERIAPHIRRTPLLRSVRLSELARGDVYLKFENQQTTGSFKLRGAMNALSSLNPDMQAKGVVASSAGNHGMGVAYAARTLGIHATIYVPRTAPDVKKNGFGAIDMARLGRSIDQVAFAAKLQKKPAPGDIFTDAYLPPKADRAVE